MTEHDARILGPKSKAVHDPKAAGEYARGHWFCAMCGADWTPRHVHHILGGRRGRSDEAANFLSVCHDPCHPFCDLAKNLAVVLAFKARIGELTDAAIARLKQLNDGHLPDVVTIPEEWQKKWRQNRPELNGG